MAKPRQRHQGAIPANKNSTPSCYEVDTHEEDWVVVKKQKVNILIPCLPIREQLEVPNQEEIQPQARHKKTTEMQSPCQIETNIQRHSVVSDGEKSMSLTLERTVPDAKKSTAPKPIARSPNLHRRMRLENPGVDNSRGHRTLVVSRALKLRRNPRSFLDGSVLLNQNIRALNLERKLERAGGLSSWLASLGLDQFVKIFQGKSVNKFQLVNLTMKKLKDMGAIAVGPRRKLMHAIDCLCEPYCFESL